MNVGPTLPFEILHGRQHRGCVGCATLHNSNVQVVTIYKKGAAGQVVS